MKRNLFLRCVYPLLIAFMVSGCATFRGTLGDKRVIYNLSRDLSSLIIAGEMERALELVSDNFTHEEWENKEGLRRFLTQAKELNLMNDAKLDTSETEILIEGDVATVYPIRLSAALTTNRLPVWPMVIPNGWLRFTDAGTKTSLVSPARSNRRILP